MSPILLAAAAGLVWGIADFAGGKATQQAAALAVTWLTKVCGLPVLVLALILGGSPVQPNSLGWGALAGVCGFVGLIIFNQVMASGAMSVAAPVTAVTSSALPVLVGLALGERPGPTTLVGVGCAIAAVALVSLAPPAPGAGADRLPRPRLVGAAAISGLFFGTMFILLAVAARTPSAPAGLWPVAAAQLTGLALGAVLIAINRPTPWPGRSARGWALVAGSFDISASALYLVAAPHGDVSVLAPLVGLYPVTTVLLALLIDRERLRGRQIFGLGLAVLALILVNR